MLISGRSVISQIFANSQKLTFSTVSGGLPTLEVASGAGRWATLLRGPPIKMFTGCIGFSFGPVDCAFDTLRWPVDRIKTQRFLSGIDDIVLGVCWNDDTVIGLYLIGHIVDPDFAASRFKTKELIAIVVNFFADFFARLERHEHQLDVFASIENFTEVVVSFGQLFDVVCKTLHVVDLP
ncbi:MULTISPECIES: hypothetical protein [Pseudohalocynthiibacter]|jgi:hypothetical protein|uniref:hypothetical protein n=1 Tax=Pseudohalocynthiibacter sp. F2068 TaxID=2926418 RepID=UPI001FE53946|nr:MULTISPECIES: hypothetical protein [Pseudohalocynthiibacter]MCK0103865.1 hypothetical protein [Pseudohalocynthiibacter sp. F2068]